MKVSRQSNKKEREKVRGSEKERPTERDIQTQIGKTEG